MANTSRGYPLFQQTDNADIASKLNAISTAVNNDVATVASGVSTYFSPRIKQVQRIGTGQTIADSTHAALVGYTTTTIQIGAAISHSAGVFTPDFGGAVEVSAFVLWPVVSAAHRSILRIYLNGAQTPDGIDTKWLPAGTAGQTGHTIRSIFDVSSGDQITATAFQDSGASVTIADNGAVYTIRRIA